MYPIISCYDVVSNVGLRDVCAARPCLNIFFVALTVNSNLALLQKSQSI